MQRPLPPISQGRTKAFIDHRLGDRLSDILGDVGGPSLALSRIRSFAEQPVLIGYMRVFKADGSQTSTYSAMRCSPPASNRGTSTRTRPPASAITGRVWKRA